MNYVKWAFLIYATLCLKLVVWPELSASYYLPDPTVVVAVLAMLAVESPYAFAVAGLVGLADDLLWGERLGALMLVCLVVGYWMSGARQWFGGDSTARSVGAAGLLAGATLLGKAALLRFMDGTSMNWEPMVGRAVIDGAFVGACAVGAHALLLKTSDNLRTVFRPAEA